MATVHKNLRVFYQSPDERLLAAESLPQVRTIKVARGEGDSDNTAFYLSFPYVQFYVEGVSLHVTFSKKSVQKVVQDKVYFPFLPNVYYGTVRICLSVSDEVGYDRSGCFPVPYPTEENMEKVMTKFWASQFFISKSWLGCWSVPNAISQTEGFTFGVGIEDFRNLATKQFEDWEEGTKREGVDFISNLEWCQPSFKDLPFMLKNAGSVTLEGEFPKRCLSGI